MSREKTKFRYRVHHDRFGKVLHNWDFIAQDPRHWYYQPIAQIRWEFVWMVFDRWLEQVRNNDQTFDRDQICKFPYLYQSLKTEQETRFPLIMRENHDLITGNGRAIVVSRYFPHIPLDAVVVSPHTLDLEPLTSVKGFEDILLKRSFFKNKPNIKWNFNIDVHDDLTANDYNDFNDFKNTGSSRFAFCDNTLKDPKIWQQAEQIIKSCNDRFDIIDRLVNIKIDS